MEDVRVIIVVMLLLLTALTVVPSVGALVFGFWLRRQLSD